MNEKKDFDSLKEREEELFARFLEKNSQSSPKEEKRGDEIESTKDFLPDFAEMKNYEKEHAWKKLSVFWSLFRKKENFRKTASLLLPGILVLFLFLNICTVSKDYSYEENRPLASFPKITWSSVTSGQFMKDFETYISDQFIFRNSFVSLKRNFEKLCGKEENHNILFCDDSYLIQNTSQIDQKNLSSNIQAINDLAKVDRYNVKVAIIPTAYEILKDKLPRFAYTDSYGKLQKTLEKKLENVENIDTAEVLGQNSDKYIYYRTDHHQTALGSYYTYCALAPSLGYEPYELDAFEAQTMSNDFLGSTWSDSGFEKTVADSIVNYSLTPATSCTLDFDDGSDIKQTLYSENKLIQKDKYAYYLDGNHAVAKIKSGAKTDKKIAIIKDSYAHSIVPFLANHFSEIYLLDLRYYNGDVYEFLYEYNIKDVLVLYNHNTFLEDSNLGKISSLYEHSVYTSVPDISYGVVPKIDSEDASYFDDAVFVGDSLTIGIELFSGFNAEFLCMGGLSTRNLETAALPNGKTVMQSIRDMQHLGKLYIMFGTNEVAFDEMDQFLQRYSLFIDEVRKVHPDVLIYIESIMPVTKKTSEETDIKNDRITVYNEHLLQMAKQKQCYYVDVNSYFRGEDGYLPDNIGSDGIHLGPAKYREMASYILSRAVPVAGTKKIADKGKAAFASGGTIDTKALGDKILSSVAFKDELAQVSDSLVLSCYELDGQKVCSAVLYLGGGATAEEVAVFEMKSGTDAKELVDLAKKRVERKKRDFEDYIPAEMTKLNKAVIVRKSNVVAVCIADNVDEQTILDILK